MSDGVRMIPVETPSGSFEVWTREAGDNPRLRLLLMHGGPGATHEYLLPMEKDLVDAGVEVHFYDQLGSHLSDQPDEPVLWEIDRFVDEVEQVRVALALGRDDFVLYGQSWGGLLGTDYAERVLMPTMDQTALAEIKRLEADDETDDPSYEQLLMEHHYVHQVVRRPADQWPEEVVRSHDTMDPAHLRWMAGHDLERADA